MKGAYSAAGLTLVLAMAACGRSPSAEQEARVKVLHDLPASIILPTYRQLDTRAAELAERIAVLAAEPTEPNLELARTAWREARRSWEQGEGFLFGPVDSDGLDPQIDSWPVNRTDLDAVLAGADSLTVEAVSRLDVTLQGFHTLEYLLWGTGKKRAADLTKRELAYLQASAGALKQATGALVSAWSTDGGNYLSVLQSAGEPSNAIYPSQQAGLQELVNGLIKIADELSATKIAEPLEARDPALQESQFSDNSLADYLDNVRSIDHVYRGVYGSDSVAGLTTLVRPGAAQVDERIRREIADALIALEALAPSFGDAILTRPVAVESARQAVATLRATLERDLLPLVE